MKRSPIGKTVFPANFVAKRSETGETQFVAPFVGEVAHKLDQLRQQRLFVSLRATMPSAWLELDTDLRERLRDVLDEPRRPVTEAELRKLSDEGRACRLLLGAELERLERRLGKADGDPQSSLGEIAEAYRRVHVFRGHVEELDGLMAALDDRAREVRSSWRQHMTNRSR